MPRCGSSAWTGNGSYPPLFVPVDHPPILEPPGPPLLSEDEKRDRLRAALAAQTAADTALASARSATTPAPVNICTNASRR